MWPTASCSDRIDILDDGDEWRSAKWQPRDERNIIITPDGFFVLESEEFMRALRPARRADFQRMFGFRFLGDMKRGFAELETKIPFSYAMLAIAFFKRAWEICHSEEILLIYYFYDKKQYWLKHPRITARSQFGVSFNSPITPEGAVLFGDFHSHGNFEASHSPTDKTDDLSSPGVHIIIGDLNRDLQTIRCVHSSGEYVTPVSVLDVFDFPQRESGIPEQWIRDLDMPAPKHLQEDRSAGFAHKQRRKP